MPFAPSSFLFLIVTPGAPSSVFAPKYAKVLCKLFCSIGTVLRCFEAGVDAIPFWTFADGSTHAGVLSVSVPWIEKLKQAALSCTEPLKVESEDLESRVSPQSGEKRHLSDLGTPNCRSTSQHVFLVK